MPKSRICELLSFVASLFVASLAPGQVVAPIEIKNPELRSLQFKYIEDLKAIGSEVANTSFPYPFYLSRKLDLDEQQQKSADQRSIRFDEYGGRTVLAVTGNYYAAYSADQLQKDQRARTTFLAVVEPILQVAVPKFQTNSSVQGFAFEISHHIKGKVMGVTMERPENLMVFLPRNSALKLLAAKNDDSRQAALLEGQYFINAEPITLWLEGKGPQVGLKLPPPDAANGGDQASTVDAQITNPAEGHSLVDKIVPSFPKHSTAVDVISHPHLSRDTSPQNLASLQSANKQVLDTMLRELDQQAHFVSYALPSFVAFRQSIFLELSINTTLVEGALGSRYRLAAVAFDDHIAHLIRPVLAYFKPDLKQEPQFDGIGFSTTVHLSGKGQPSAGSEAVEFFFPLEALRCYESYDCTGQQLIDAGAVLINGERVSLDLQVAENSSR